MSSGPESVPVRSPVPIGPATRLIELPLPAPVVVEPRASIATVAEAMHDRRTGAVIVGGSSPAIATEHDIVRALATSSVDEPIETVASPDPVAVLESETLLGATRLMVDSGVRHLVVLSADGTVRSILPQGLALQLLVDGLDHVVWEASRLRAAHVEIRARPF